MAVTETGHRASREIDDLYRAHGPEVYRYAFAVLGNHADAEDVTQTTFLNAYRALEGGVRPRKPSNWLLTIASNAIKQRFRQEQARPRQVQLDERIPHSAPIDDDEGPSVGELLTALSKIPPQQRQAIVLREFEGRSYVEIAEILGVTTSALETLLFRARRSLAEELEHQLSCTDAQLAVSRSVDGRLGRKERRRLRDHLAECPDCARFARLQERHSSALRGLALIPIPLSLAMFKGLEGTASAAVVPIGAAGAGAGAGAGAVAVGAGIGTTGAAGTSGGILAGGLGLKAAAVVAAAGVAGGVGVAGSTEVDAKPRGAKGSTTQVERGERLGQVAPRGVSVPGNGVARGKPNAPGQTKLASRAKAETSKRGRASVQKSKSPTKSARGQAVSADKRRAAAEKRAARIRRQSRAQAANTKRAQNAQATPKVQREPKPKAKSGKSTPAATAPADTPQAEQTPQSDPAPSAPEPTSQEPSPESGNGNGNAGPKK